jgi:phosphate acetyltransferase
MTRNIIFVPIGENQDIIENILYFSKFFKKNQISCNYFNPIIKKNTLKKVIKNSSYYINKFYDNDHIIKSSFINNFTELLEKKRYIYILEKILDMYSLKSNNEMVLIKGISYSDNISMNFFNQLNLDIANILNADIIFLFTLKNNFIKNFLYKYYIINDFFLKKHCSKNLGIIINLPDNNLLKENIFLNNFYCEKIENNFFKQGFSKNSFLKYKKMPILGIFSLNKNNFSVSRNFLLKKLLVQEKYIDDMNDVLIHSIILYKNEYRNIENFLNKNTLLIVYLSNFIFLKDIYSFLKMNKNIFSILIIKNCKLNFIENKLYSNLKNIGISIFFTKIDSFDIFSCLSKVNYFKKIQCSKVDFKKRNFSIFSDKIFSILNNNGQFNKEICSYKFLYQLKKKSQKLKKTIIFPEGENIKIIQAVYLCEKLDICNCVLLGNPILIYKKAQKLNLILSSKIKIYDPKLIISDYINFFSKIYKNNNLKECKEILMKNNIIISMILLKKFSKYHGLVAGIENTTADVIRPALKIIKMKEKVKLISSIFFMLFKEKVFVYGDCAINPNPSALDLSRIAIQSADSSKLFGITPKIAMLSYSTNDSGSGLMVEKVRRATELVRQKRPDLIIEGPIQYDAATDKYVSKIKCPNSKIFGQANVFIFPDLNSGNITYKAVQRSCSIISIGPMIQGLSKPVNDLSRGASVKDILYTITVTAIQSHEN